MKNRISTEDCGNQVYVITCGTTANEQCLRDFLEQHDYTFFTASEGSESFHHIQDAMVAPQVSAQQNDNAPGFTEESMPRETEELTPQETLLSRESLHGNYEDLLGESTRHLETLKYIDLFAKSAQTVLISGETGTGKELVAHALQAQSPRAAHTMVVVNCEGLRMT